MQLLLLVATLSLNLSHATELEDACQKVGGKFIPSTKSPILGRCYCQRRKKYIVPAKENCNDFSEIDDFPSVLNALSVHADETCLPIVNADQKDPIESCEVDEKYLAELTSKLRFGESGAGWKEHLVTPNDIEKLIQLKHNSRARSLLTLIGNIKHKTEKRLQAYSVLSQERIAELNDRNKKNQLSSGDLKLLIQAKVDWIDLIDGPGSFIHIRSFFKDKEGLKNLMNLVEIQGSQLDDAQDEYLVSKRQESLEELKRTGKPQKEFLVVGAGPIGLYSAIRLMLEGEKTRLVNDRDEDYRRKQIVGLDPKWTAELRLLLGSKFNQVFGLDEEMLSEGHLERFSGDDSAEGTTRLIEDILKQRAVELSSRIESKSHPKDSPKDPGIRFDFQLRAEDIEYSNEGFKVLLAGSKNPSKDREGEIFDRSQERELSRTDVVVFAGGSNSAFQNRFLGPRILRTETADYSVSAWNKKAPEIQTPSLFSGHRLEGQRRGTIDAKTLTENLDKVQIQKLISESSALSPEMKSRYNNLVLLTKSEAYPVILNGKITQGWEIRKFENRKTIYFAMATPRSIVRFSEELDTEIQKSKGTARAKDLENLRGEFKKRWFTAGMKSVMEAPERLEKEAELDPDPINQTIFTLGQYSRQNSTKVFRGKNKSELFMAAVGDCNVSPHFFSGSGLTTGRTSVRNLLKAMKSYKPGENTQKTADLLEQQDRIAALTALFKGKWLIAKPEAEQAKYSQLETIQALNIASNQKRISENISVKRVGNSYVLEDHRKKLKLDIAVDGVGKIHVSGELKNIPGNFQTLEDVIFFLNSEIDVMLPGDSKPRL